MTTFRSHTTILFADLTSSTRIGESLDPELVAEVLGRLRKVAEDVVGRHGGVVNQFYGDGVLAAFGFPDPKEDDVLRAISAALELHEAAAGILPIPGIDFPNFTLQMHSGIHAGLVFVQEGDCIQGRYKITGDALNTAARLADAARPNELLVSASTIQGVLPYFDAVQVPSLKLKGKSQPLDAYRVAGRTAVRTRYEASVRRGLSEFIGRQEELAELMQDFRNSAHEGIRYFELIGDPGVGKTRLCEEFLSQVQGPEIAVFKAYCEGNDSARPLQPFIQLIRALFHLEPNMTAAETLACMQERQRQEFAGLALHEEDYHRLLVPGDSADEKADGATLAQRSIQAVVALIRFLAAERHVLLYLDDWHLADDLSVKTLLTLLKEIGPYPVFILTATRTPLDEIYHFPGRSLQLRPLNLAESSQLAARYFQQRMDFAFASVLHRQSGGNPLFIEELCQSFANKPPGQSQGIGIESVPVTLSGLIAARMKRLPDELQQLVKTAAVLGNIFDLWLFESMLGEALSNEHLIELAKYDVIYQGGTQGTLRFKHGITRDVAYDKIRLQERRSLHGRASQILEAQIQTRGGEEYFELLAYHFNGAGNQTKTGYYAELAGDKALATMALDRAGAQYRRALQVLDPANGTGTSYERWRALLLKFGWVSVFDPLPDQLDVFQRGLMLAEIHHDHEGMAKTQHWLGYLHYALGDSVHAIPHCELALERASKLGAKALQVETTALLGQAKGAAAEYDNALQLLDRALHAKQQHKQNNRPSVGSAYSLACKGAVLGDQGLFPQAYECFDTALQSLRSGEHQVEGSVLGLYSAVSLWQGHWSRARDLAEKAQQVAQRISSSYMSTMYIALAEYAEWMLNGSDRSIGAIQSTTHSLEERGKMLFVSLNYGWAAEILVSMGRWKHARKYAARALVRARRQDRLGEAVAYRALALLAEHQQSASHEYYLSQAEASALARQSRHEAAKNHLHRAALLHRQNRHDVVAYHLDQALAAFQSMNMDWHELQTKELIRKCAVSA